MIQRGAVKQIPWEEGRSPIYFIQNVQGSRPNGRKAGVPYIAGAETCSEKDPMGGRQESHIFDPERCSEADPMGGRQESHIFYTKGTGEQTPWQEGRSPIYCWCREVQ